MDRIFLNIDSRFRIRNKFECYINNTVSTIWKIATNGILTSKVWYRRQASAINLIDSLLCEYERAYPKHRRLLDEAPFVN